MRVLVTGTSGFVGGAIAEHLVGLGDEVIGLSRRPARIAGLAQDLRVDLARDDVVDSVLASLDGCDAIVHAAAALDKELSATAVSRVNGAGTQQIIELGQRLAARRLLYISGVPVIGRPTELPITEDHPTRPLTAYHASKLYGEHLARLAEDAGLPSTTLRLPSPVGPGMPEGRILSVFVERALAGEPLRLVGKGSRRQNYLDVRDAALGVRVCLTEDHSGCFNLAADRPIANSALAEMCIQRLGSSSELAYLDRPDPNDGEVWDISGARARAAFGFEPRFQIEDSIDAVAAQLRPKGPQ